MRYLKGGLKDRVYTGEFVNDKISGQGQMTYANGDVYVGQWKGHKRDGKGKLTFNNGLDVWEGMWREDEKVEVN